jgi:pimeloyl-ACP methyl ester carboxylesterase
MTAVAPSGVSAGRFTPEPLGHSLFVETSTGVVHVHRRGAGDPLVLMHANGHSWHEFGESIPVLAESHDVLAWDMPGQGWSDPVHPRTSVNGYADILLEVLDALAIERATFVGSSIGAFIAISLGARDPARVSGLGLVEFQFREKAWWADNWSMIESGFAVPTQRLEEVAPRFVRDVDAAFLTRWNVERNLASSRGLIGVMWAIREFDVHAGVRAMSIPALVVFGGEGPTITCRPQLEPLLPAGSRVEVVPDAGHFVAIDQPQLFAEVIGRIPAAGHE